MTTDIEETAQAAVSSTEVALREAEALEIASEDEYQGASLTLREVKTRAKDIEDQRKRILRPLDESRARIMALFRPAQDNLAEAERLLKQGMLAWTQGQERLRREEEARLAEVARKEAERLQKRADKAAAAGHYEQAAVLGGAADAVTAPEVVPPRKPYGTSTRMVYKAEVVDKVALIQGVAEGKVPPDVITVNMPYLNQAVRALKDNLKWPGVEVAKEEIVVAQTGIRSPKAMPMPKEGDDDD